MADELDKASEATPEPAAPEADAEVTAVDPTPDSPSTSSDSSESPSGDATPVVVDNHTARNDDDARFGSFVDVVAGEHEGRVGHYCETKDSDPKTGYPLHIIVRTRDEFNELIHVAYEHVRPSRYTGGR